MNNSANQPPKSFFKGFPKVRWQYAHWYLLTAQAVTLHIWLTIFYFSPKCEMDYLSPVELTCRPWEASEPFVIPQSTLTLDQLPPPPPFGPCDMPPPPPPPPVYNHTLPEPVSDLGKPIIKPPKLNFNNLDFPLEDIDESCFFCEIDWESEQDLIYDRETPQVDYFFVSDEEPQPINLAEIKQSINFPKVAREIPDGLVVMRILVGESGQYIKHKVIDTPHPLLTKSVEKYIGGLKFAPAIRRNKPIRFWVNVPFNFKTLN